MAIITAITVGAMMVIHVVTTVTTSKKDITITMATGAILTITVIEEETVTTTGTKLPFIINAKGASWSMRSFFLFFLSDLTHHSRRELLLRG
jgi:hypothetical protein